VNATRVGGVDGAFMDHAYNNPDADPEQPNGPLQFCNGGGAKRTCWSFTAEFTARFINQHNWLLNHTQTILAATTGGPVIGGRQQHPDPSTAAGAVIAPGVWNIPTQFEALREATAQGLNGTGPYVIEASKGGCDLAHNESKLAGFLLAMEKYTYLACFSSSVPTWCEYSHRSARNVLCGLSVAVVVRSLPLHCRPCA
jgi:hypothetical protein